MCEYYHESRNLKEEAKDENHESGFRNLRWRQVLVCPANLPSIFELILTRKALEFWFVAIILAEICQNHNQKKPAKWPVVYKLFLGMIDLRFQKYVYLSKDSLLTPFKCKKFWLMTHILWCIFSLLSLFQHSQKYFTSHY